MKMQKSEKESMVLRTILIFAMIVLASALRLAPHPWNFTPVGAIALLSGAMVRDRPAGVRKFSPQRDDRPLLEAES